MQKWPYVVGELIILILVASFGQGCIRQTNALPDVLTEKTLFALSNTLTDTDILSAVIQIDLVFPGGAYPARAALIIKKPSYLRLELLPLIGPPDFFLTATPEVMKILLPSKGEFYRGKPSGRNLSRFLPWQFNIEDMVAILTSSYPPLNEAAYRSYIDGNNLRVEMKAPAGNFQTLWVDSNNHLIRLIRFDEKGGELYSAGFAEYQEGNSLARKITINMADGATSLTIRSSDLKMEKTTDLSIFDLKIPDGFQTILLD
jgi:hypothetical protein